MNINYVDYSIATRSLDIFFSGCRLRCKDCCNPELQDFNSGSNYMEWLPKIEFYLQTYSKLIDNIFLVGGSPNHQDMAKMESFLQGLKRRVNTKPIWVFCGEDNINKINPIFKTYCKYIKIGAYKPELKVDNYYQKGIKLATSNQVILEKYEDF